MEKTIKKRSQVDPKYTWATEDLYASDSDWEKDFIDTGKLIEKIQDYKGKLGSSANALVVYFKLLEEIVLKMDRVANYAQRKSDEDTKNTTYQDLASRLMNIYVAFQSANSFATNECLNISEDILNKFYKENKELLDYKRYIDEIRRQKEHILSEEQEKLLAEAGNLGDAPSTIFSMLSDADMEFPDVIGEDAKPQKLTHGTFISYLESSNREVRKDAFMKLYHTLDKFKNTSAATYFAQIKQLMFFAKARKYNSTLEAALDNTNVPVSVYKNLVKAVEDNMHYMHKYVKLRKKLLGLDELHMYDLYTTVVNNAEVKISFEEAKKNVMEAVAPLGKDYQAILKEGFENRWIDVYENEGKSSGAYSAGAKVHPYVLLNHTDSLDSEFTLAHEMGHSIHSYLSNKTQKPLDAEYVIFVAEVASTCNEALLMEYLLNKTTDKLERAYLINHFLEQFRGTIYRQTMFAEFEMITNEMAEKGMTLTADALSKVYYDLNVKYYGEDIVVDKEIAIEWARIPHFFYNFYVFQYATGYSAAIALSRKILDEGEEAVKNYKKFLSGGCSKTPIELLKIAGVDMTTAQPINEALKLFGTLIDELEELLAD
ncbi:oligoendopeptidase F [Sedimentibacter sp. zth1]|uniref:oligoendopeptidase F n=1 Tax=Sedimentibacter sp. zth1 TaxID=2816908 RepID=UPI001A9323DE|nr:oligoendopeptidase F [Sedimentibacter sp. zth1]QSX05523.1 oligoendopeptidase F [Sedimentibacter sp. zth1]